ncbi:MAG: class I SAM-dependent methyltransferase [Sulfurovum sp.]
MQTEKTDHFREKADEWDISSHIVQNAKSISDTIVANISLTKEMRVMDFGAGTGLLCSFVSAHVGEVIAVDNSPAMLEKFRAKCDTIKCKSSIIQKDLSIETIDDKFDGIISSMTIHHLEDTPALFSKFYNMLDDGGFIAIADLDTEDGSFHSDNTGVFHFGFDREVLRNIAMEVGFRDIKFEKASTISKPHHEFTIFLMMGWK